MNPNAGTLARRDAALACIMGAIGMSGADFGRDFSPPGSGDKTNGDDRYHANRSPFGKDRDFTFGGSDRNFRFGEDAGAASAARRARTQMRRDLIVPNDGSDLDVERYFMNINKDLVLGTAATYNENATPAFNIRNQRLISNVPAPGMVYLTDVLLGNVNANGGGTADAYSFNPNATGVSLDLPLLQTMNKLTLKGSYSGYIPVGYAPAFAFTLCYTLIGPSTMTP